MSKIFGIGLSRTGTTSCCAFFNQLGITAIHLPFSMADIDNHIFSNDTSVSARFEDLDRLYPNSKFIYTTRAPREWVASCLKWVKLGARKAWYFKLSDDCARKWVSDSDFKLYGRHYMEMPDITEAELLKAYDRHHQHVGDYFRNRPDDFLVVDITDRNSLPFATLMKFLEYHGLFRVPKINSLTDLNPLSMSVSPGYVIGDDTKKEDTDASPSSDPLSSAKVQFRIANIWHKKGKLERAVSGYQRALQIDPRHVPAYLELGNLRCDQKRFPEAIDVYRGGLEVDPNEARLHKGLVNAFAESKNLDEAFNEYKLTRKDNKEIDLQPEDVLCCVVVRNESARLPYFLSYYRQKGISKFFAVDNDSTDDSPEYLLAQPDVYTWHSSLSFNKANFGAGWFELLLRKYGDHHWCVIADADEILCYPAWESKSIVELCRELDVEGKRAFNAVLLDMYSDKPVKDTHYKPGTPFLKRCSFFDKKFYHTKYENAGPYRNQDCYFGGVRQRVFGETGAYYLSKVPLLKYGSDFILAGGQHWTNCPKDDISDQSGCLLHFKYFSSFHNYVQQEVERKEHFGKGMQYEQYARSLVKNETLSFFDKRHSLKFENSQQLVDFGIMKFPERQAPAPMIRFPLISKRSVKKNRPFWSVKITVYDRLEYIERALQSVLEQAPDPEEMDIEVVADGSRKAIQDEIKQIVTNTAGSRVSVHLHPQNAGHPDIFNICIQRSPGYWVHILHDDDWVEDGFYKKLSAGIEEAPVIGAAFCRHVHTDQRRQPLSISRLERKTPGILDNWLERIAVMCCIQFSSIVVKRNVYETLGGFCSQADSAFDWEMWTRLAAHYPIWYEPSILACAGKDGKAETDRLRKSGNQIADALKAIEIFRSYLPERLKNHLPIKAREHYAVYAITMAKQYLLESDYEAAVANIRQGLKCSHSVGVKDALISLLRES